MTSFLPYKHLILRKTIWTLRSQKKSFRLTKDKRTQRFDAIYVGNIHPMGSNQVYKQLYAQLMLLTQLLCNNKKHEFVHISARRQSFRNNEQTNTTTDYLWR